jgi:hypothetical protein
VNSNLCLDEFSRVGLIQSLDKCTKIFMADEADITFVDVGLFSGFAKPSAEMNCRCLSGFSLQYNLCECLALIIVSYDRMLSPYVRQLAKKTIVVEKIMLLLSEGATRCCFM